MLSKNVIDIFSKSTLLLLAIFLQIQITLFETDSYIGLRANLADLLLPFLGLFVLGTLILKRSLWPQWEKPFGYWAPILLTAIIAFGLFNGYRLQGSFNIWAFGNKGVGWLVLMAYLALAAWIATNRPFDEIRTWFFRPFVVFLCFLTFIEIIVRLLIQNELIEPFTVLDALKHIEISGFMGNRNAFALLYFSALIILSTLIFKNIKMSKIENLCFQLMWFFVPMLIIMNSSRSTLLIILPLFTFLLVMNWRFFLKKVLPLILVGMLLVPLTDATQSYRFAKKIITFQYGAAGFFHDEFGVDGMQGSFTSGDSARVDVIMEGFELFKENPISGAGIGSIYINQGMKTAPETVYIVHNTTLWILFEMGPFGLLGFAAVLAAVMMTFYKKARDQQNAEGVFALGVLLSLIAFGAFSLFHEILYTRFFWVFLGLALVSKSLKAHQH